MVIAANLKFITGFVSYHNYVIKIMIVGLFSRQQDGSTLITEMKQPLAYVVLCYVVLCSFTKSSTIDFIVILISLSMIVFCHPQY